MLEAEMLSLSEMHKIAEVLQSELFILSYINRIIKGPDKYQITVVFK